jgi:hypothetical protein
MGSFDIPAPYIYTPMSVIISLLNLALSRDCCSLAGRRITIKSPWHSSTRTCSFQGVTAFDISGSDGSLKDRNSFLFDRVSEHESGLSTTESTGIDT